MLQQIISPCPCFKEVKVERQRVDHNPKIIQQISPVRLGYSYAFLVETA